MVDHANSLNPILRRDPRNPAAPRRVHSYTHSDDITAIHFLKPNAGQSYPNVLLSASSDGLLCTSDPEEDDEDEAGLHVGNWGTSIAQTGWIYGQSNTPGVWSSSDMETFGIWSSEVRFYEYFSNSFILPIDHIVPYKLDRIQDGDIREPSIHKQNFTWVTDYLISCHNGSKILPDHDNELNVFLGSNEYVPLARSHLISELTNPSGEILLCCRDLLCRILKVLGCFTDCGQGVMSVL